MGMEAAAATENAEAKPIWQAPVIEVFDVTEAEAGPTPITEPTSSS
ncbi:hypothetical protein GCM10011611_10300 [Aliidongia dinghuensis]|uniref:Uncharacterized protein n=1 Tax=Aliidongia dinghuensis TaxID=1867774 RepID=A0A8J2YQH0_9PROT|nr:hypothetical protein [Aliidongia dinghuensis]GGF06744.1 hypothetical protein GCM10011611_10300 [Aliidongia dinghuensis]